MRLKPSTAPMPVSDGDHTFFLERHALQPPVPPPLAFAIDSSSRPRFEQCHRHPSARESGFDHVSNGPHRRDAIALLPQRVLVRSRSRPLFHQRRPRGLRSILVRSLPASSGDARIAHRLMCVRYSSAFIPPLPTSSMSGSFQCPGPRILRQAGLRKPVLRHAPIVVLNIVGRAPQIAAHTRPPRPHRVPPVLA